MYTNFLILSILIIFAAVATGMIEPFISIHVPAPSVTFQRRINSRGTPQRVTPADYRVQNTDVLLGAVAAGVI
jgi:hypothetical protein